MATISGIVAARQGRAGSGGSWVVTAVDQYYRKDPEVPEYELRHHGTLMLRWEDHREMDPEQDEEILVCEAQYMSTGWGSVSDQGGMNVAFHVLNLPYYYARAGGADILILHRIPQEGHSPIHARRMASRERPLSADAYRWSPDLLD